ncbi:SRPBCC family protein [Alloalcanivorax xenomutans]|uniref:SRPBCC family protein n=1 Tax=Alloalcanivorax xenomutans TaxID=1094342 RepID=UPI0024E2037E|nr:SRPBCC family protein [Alloalcanivorax xenomutans]
MDDYAKLTKPDTLTLERLLPGPVERIWAFLTESEKRARWLAAGPMGLFAGGAVTLEFHHNELSEPGDTAPEYHADAEGAVLKGTVTRCEAPHFLAFTWGEGGSEVTFELTPEDNQVRLRVTHQRLSDTEKTSVATGWHTHLAILVAELNETTPPSFWALHTELEACYRKQLSMN